MHREVGLSVHRQILSYGLIGVLNTALTASIIALLTVTGINLVIANGAGFAAGLMTSFFLNSLFTFRNKQAGKSVPFFTAFALAYGLNLLIVLTLSFSPNVHDLVAQAAGMATYNVSFFVLMKLWVFASA